MVRKFRNVFEGNRLSQERARKGGKYSGYLLIERLIGLPT